MDPTIIDILSLKDPSYIQSYQEYRVKNSIEALESEESDLEPQPWQGTELNIESKDIGTTARYPIINPYLSFKVTSSLGLFLSNIDYILQVTPFKVYDPTVLPKSDIVFKYAEYGRAGGVNIESNDYLNGIYDYIDWRSYNHPSSKYEGYIFRNDKTDNIIPHLNEKVVSKIPTAVNLIFVDYYDENLIYRALRDAFNDITPLAAKNCVFIAPFVYKDKYDLNSQIHTLFAISQLFTDFYVIRPVTTNLWGPKTLYAIGKNRIANQPSGSLADDSSDKINPTLKGLQIYKRLTYSEIPKSFIKYINEMTTIKDSRLQELKYAPYWKLIHLLHIKDVSTVSVSTLSAGGVNNLLGRRLERGLEKNGTTLLGTPSQKFKNGTQDINNRVDDDHSTSTSTDTKGSVSVKKDSTTSVRNRKNSVSDQNNIDIIKLNVRKNNASSVQAIEELENEKMDDLALRPGSPSYKYSRVLRRVSDAILNIGYSSINNIDIETVEKITNRFTTINKLTQLLKTTFPNVSNAVIDFLTANIVLSSRIIDSTRTDPILPARWANISTDQLFLDMNLNMEQMQKLVLDISGIIRNYKYSSNKKSILEEHIEVVNNDDKTLSLSCENGPTYSISRQMLDKLHILYKSSNTGFDATTYALIARYDLLPFIFFPKDVMDFFKTTFNANLQLFTSPLTAELPQYTSYFEDTDLLFGSKGNIFVKDTLNKLISHIRNPTVVVEPLLNDFYLQTVVDLANTNLNMGKPTIWIIPCPLTQIMENGNLIEHPVLSHLKNNTFTKWWASFDYSTYNWRSIRLDLVPALEPIALFILSNQDIDFDVNSQYKLFQLMTREQTVNEDVPKLLLEIKKTHELTDIEEELINTYLKLIIPDAVPSFLQKVLTGNRSLFNKLINEMLTDSQINNTSKINLLAHVSLNSSYSQKQVDPLRIYKFYTLFVFKIKTVNNNTQAVDFWYKKFEFNPKSYKSEHDRILGLYKSFRDYIIGSDAIKYESLIKFINQQ